MKPTAFSFINFMAMSKTEQRKKLRGSILAPLPLCPFCNYRCSGNASCREPVRPHLPAISGSSLASGLSKISALSSSPGASDAQSRRLKKGRYSKIQSSRPSGVAGSTESQASKTKAALHINKEATMESFEHRQTTSRFRDLLLRVTDTDQRQQIQQLLAEEEVKALPPRLGPPLK